MNLSRLLIVCRDIKDGMDSFNFLFPIGYREGIDVYLAFDDQTLDNFDHLLADRIICTKDCDFDLYNRAYILYSGKGVPLGKLPPLGQYSESELVPNPGEGDCSIFGKLINNWI